MSKNAFEQTDFVRVAPKWQFWNKQETAFIYCTKKGCDWKRRITKWHRGAMAGHAASWSIGMSMNLHADTHATKKKKGTK